MIRYVAKPNKIKPINIQNKKASFEYHLETRFVAGIALTGSEVKSVREGHASISEAYCLLEGNKIMVRNMHISEFRNAGYQQHKPVHDRMLLLHKHEIRKIQEKLKDVGYTLIPVALFFSETGYAKLEIALAKGKKVYDKREDLKTRDLKREMERH